MVEVIDATDTATARAHYIGEVVDGLDLSAPYEQVIRTAAERLANEYNADLGLAVAAFGGGHPQRAHRELVGMVVEALAERGVRPEQSVRVGVDVLLRS